MFPDSVIAKDFKCGRIKATAILKVIAQDVPKKLLCAVSDSQYFSLQTDETTDITVTQEAAVMLRYFDNSLGKVRLGASFTHWIKLKRLISVTCLIVSISIFKIVTC